MREIFALAFPRSHKSPNGLIVCEFTGPESVDGSRPFRLLPPVNNPGRLMKDGHFYLTGINDGAPGNEIGPWPKSRIKWKGPVRDDLTYAEAESLALYHLKGRRS